MVIVAGNWDQRLAQIDGVWMSPGDPGFAESYSDQLARAIDLFASQGIPVYVSTTKALNEAHDRSLAMNKLIIAATEQNPDATLLDLGGYLCRPGEVDSCPETRDGQPIVDATGHPAPYWQAKMAEYALGIITNDVMGN